MMQKYFLYSVFLFSLVITGCSKEKQIEDYQFSKVIVSSKSYIGTPNVDAYIDGVSMGTILPGRSGSKLIPGAGDSVKLTVKDPVTSELLLDSTFLPGMDNRFTILIDNTLGIRQFYTPSTAPVRPVPTDSFRIQIFHKIEYQNIKRTVTFKIFEDLSGSTTTVDLHELPIQITVPYGQVSSELNIPYQLKTNGRPKKYRVKAYDAITGEILVDILAPYSASTPRLEIVGAGQYKLLYLKVVSNASTPTKLAWSYADADKYEPLL